VGREGDGDEAAMMRHFVLALALASFSGPAKSQMTDEQFIQAAARLAHAARIMGACEQYLPEKDALQNLSRITAWLDSAEPALREIGGYISSQYAKGRAESDRWSGDRCVSEMNRASESMRALESGAPQ
jgi:hypothetical protein